MDKSIKKISDTNFETVFSAWKDREGSNPGWINCATKIKGWPDWESWRRFSMSLLKAEQRDWETYEIINPGSFIPDMLIGPYTGWQNFLPEKNKFSFKQALEHQGFFKNFSNHEAVKGLMKGFPQETRLIGAIIENNNKIICLEGHHRSTAVALANKLGTPINFSKRKVIIDIMLLPKEDELLLDKMLARGSTKIY